jgi:hypothetical protein
MDLRVDGGLNCNFISLFNAHQVIELCDILLCQPVVAFYFLVKRLLQLMELMAMRRPTTMVAMWMKKSRQEWVGAWGGCTSSMGCVAPYRVVKM